MPDALSILPVLISACALLVSYAAFCFTRRAWYETNRPVVTAEIVTHAAGNEAIAYDLVVQNVGNRPATNIRLRASSKAVNALTQPHAAPNGMREIARCFSEEGLIALLHPGKSVRNGFGHAQREEVKGALQYGASAEAEIVYSDLSARRFKSKIKLVVKDSACFAHSGWADDDRRHAAQ